MKISKLFSLALFIATFFLSTSIFAQEKSIVETAVGNENFSTLVTALKSANLVDALSQEGPFTVFAPVNDAFAKLPEGTVSNLLKEENKSTLQSILTYHVVSGNVKAKDLIAAIETNDGSTEIETLAGEKLTAKIKDGHAYLVDKNGNWSKITTTDLHQSNGVIHIIDSVLLPGS